MFFNCDVYPLQILLSAMPLHVIFLYISASKNQCFSTSLFKTSLLFTDAYTFQNKKNMGSVSQPTLVR